MKNAESLKPDDGSSVPNRRSLFSLAGLFILMALICVFAGLEGLADEGLSLVSYAFASALLFMGVGSILVARGFWTTNDFARWTGIVFLGDLAVVTLLLVAADS
ncbi:MAG: hypothetical protein GEU75_06830 [Dehalococcoidia bacterium]|nr:hypothetical protein [Dehalococcoidia bacterium]